jgi:hypothetical protein
LRSSTSNPAMSSRSSSAARRSKGPAGQHRQSGSAGRAAQGSAAGRRELLPPGLAAVRGDGSAAHHGGTQGVGRHRLARSADQRARYLPQPQDRARQLERPGPGLPDPRGHEAADTGEGSGLGIEAEYEEAVRLFKCG